jgi:3-oxoadipate enol-lactonase
MTMQTSGGMIHVNGVDLSYDEAGKGPPCVLTHGGMLDRRMWDEQVEALADSYRVIRWDVRGFGRSGWNPAVYNNRVDLHALLASLGVERAHHIGLSMGAGIVLDFAVNYPNAVDRLVVSPGGVSIPWHEESPEMAAGWEEISAAAQRGDLDAARELILAYPPMRPAAAIPAIRARLLQMLGDYSWVHHRNPSESPEAEPPIVDRLNEITAPLLMLVGGDDIPDFQGEAKIIAERVPHAELRVIEGVGHMINLEKPEEYNAVLLEFLGRA